MMLRLELLTLCFLILLSILWPAYATSQAPMRANLTQKPKIGSNQGPYYGQPEQVALSYAGHVSRMYVTWITFDDTFTSLVEYGLNDTFQWAVTGNSTLFIDGGPLKSKRYVHRVLLTGIKAGKTYQYHVGSEYGWSAIYRFTGLTERPSGGFIYAVYGDLGNVNPRSLGKLQQLAQRGQFDMVLHVGDIAYNLDTDNGEFGDQFGRQLEPLAAYVPYMVLVGNHEAAYNFSHLVNRYTMPNTEHNLFYSFDLGLAHFIAFSTEFYYFTNFGTVQLANQWEWLNNNLKHAAANRHKRPWIITLGHRPMYCSNFDLEDCTGYESRVRVGMPGMHEYGLEKLFYTYGVDLEIWAHEHSYERMWPLYNRTVYNGTKQPYTDPPAPVHIVSGSAGCQEYVDPFVQHPPPWSAFRSSNYGFGRMQIFNATHLHFEQILASKNAAEDSFWLIKHEHRSYTAADRRQLQRFGKYVPYNYCHHHSHCPDDSSSEKIKQ